MTPFERKTEIEKRLRQALAPTFIEIIDESHQHVGHEGAKSGASHFFVIITTDKFAGLSLLQKHQMVYQELKDLIPKEIHALKIKANTPD